MKKTYILYEIECLEARFADRGSGKHDQQRALTFIGEHQVRTPSAPRCCRWPDCKCEACSEAPLQDG